MLQGLGTLVFIEAGLLVKTSRLLIHVYIQDE